MKEVNAKGMQCPRPLIETKKALGEISVGEDLVVLLDDSIALENVERYLKGLGFSPIIIKKEDGVLEIKVNKTKAVSDISTVVKSESKKEEGTEKEKGAVVVIKSQAMGEGTEELGKLLMQAFINTLPEISPLPERIIFYNGGIFFVIKDSPVLKSLQFLEQRDVEIQVCGTCLDYYAKKAELAVGRVTNMYDILENLNWNKHIINP